MSQKQEPTMQEVLNAINVFATDMRDQFAQLESRINERFAQVDQKFVQLEFRMNERFDGLEERMDKAEVNIRRLQNTVDGLVLSNERLRIDHIVITDMQRRHEDRITRLEKIQGIA